MAALGMTSRGADEEELMAIANAIHLEEHITDVMEQDPSNADKWGRELDAARANRQALVKGWSRGRGDPALWCKVKHSLSKELHIREMLANAVRIEPGRVMQMSSALHDAVRHRKRLAHEFLSGKPGGRDCARCADDFQIEDDSAQSLNMPDGIYESGDTMKGDFKKFGSVGMGQLLGEAGVYGADKIEEMVGGGSGIMRTRNLVNVLGGIGVAILPGMFLKGKSGKLNDMLMVAGTHMAAKGVADIVKDSVGGTSVRMRSAAQRVMRRSTPAMRPTNYGPNSPMVALY